MTSQTSTSSQKGKRAYRKKTENVEEPVEQSTNMLQILKNDNTEEAMRLKLLQTKELQKMRGRAKGVKAGVSAESPSAQPSVSVMQQRSLESNFTTQQDQPDVNPLREKYIEERMRQIKGGVTEKDATTESANTDLFTTPDHLKSESESRPAENSNWLTGIVEVQLPVEYKLKNIEETEKARRELLQNSQLASNSSQGDQSAIDGASFASIRYQTDRKRQGNERASDDRVMEAFKKRFRK